MSTTEEAMADKESQGELFQSPNIVADVDATILEREFT